MTSFPAFSRLFGENAVKNGERYICLYKKWKFPRWLEDTNRDKNNVLVVYFSVSCAERRLSGCSEFRTQSPQALWLAVGRQERLTAGQKAGGLWVRENGGMLLKKFLRARSFKQPQFLQKMTCSKFDSEPENYTVEQMKRWLKYRGFKQAEPSYSPFKYGR